MLKNQTSGAFRVTQKWALLDTIITILWINDSQGELTDKGERK